MPGSHCDARYGQSVRLDSDTLTMLTLLAARHTAWDSFSSTTDRPSCLRHLKVEPFGLHLAANPGLAGFCPNAGPTNYLTLGSGVAVGGNPAGAGLSARACTLSAGDRIVPTTIRRFPHSDPSGGVE